MKSVCFFLFICCNLLLTSCCCNEEKSCPKENVCQSAQWFEKGEWLNGCKLTPDASIDKKLFAEHYAKFPERWDKLFAFLRDNDLSKIPDGQEIVIDEKVKAGGISSYTTRAPGEELLEVHRKEIDLQLMVEGTELMGITDTIGWKVVKPYQGDAEFGQVVSMNYRIAKPDRFFIFFPTDAHIPCIQYGDTMKVRKVVFKIKID